ncbi:uncharacterized protein RSE6_00236 [Rhynchosporium secalis]|uniref:Uncharacterized protein n=1 Tax=Rhynchosporium secalis TaxID=38038 RepID=A0A1E1LUR4_RHYSE|nr:uncharacterized protein RSE6_00236 [Rhynchosporium secalis]
MLGLMANNSAEDSEGYLEGEVLKSFFSIAGEEGTFQYTKGHEKIPDDYFKRAIGDKYSPGMFRTDIPGSCSSKLTDLRL